MPGSEKSGQRVPSGTICDLASDIGIVVVCVWMGYLVYSYKIGRISGEGKPSLLAIEFLPAPSGSEHYKWKSTSVYTVVNYFSMDCPHCRALDTIEAENKDSYQKAFSLIYRHSPLAIHPLSAGKAVIAECVYSQSGDEKMFAFISDTYANYQASARDNNWVMDIAKKYVPDTKNLTECSSSDSMKKKIEQQKLEALSYGVNGTPTIGVFKDETLGFRLDTRGETIIKRVMDYLASEVK